MTDEVQQGSVESWEIAKNYSSLLGALPSSFTSAVRSLLHDSARTEGQQGNGARFQSQRLFRAPNLGATLFFGCRALRPERFPRGTTPSPLTLTALFTSAELAAFIATVYLFRRARKLCPQDAWAPLEQAGQLQSNLGFIVGESMPSIGAGTGLLVGGIRYVAFATLHMHDQKGAREYQRYLKVRKLTYDPDYEFSRWGCTSAQIGASMLQSFGFGVAFANAYALAFSTYPPLLDESDEEVYRLAIAQLWISTLHTTRTEPQMTHRGQYYPTKEAHAALVRKAEAMCSDEPRFLWLMKGKEDLSEPLAPSSDTEAPHTDDLDGHDDGDLPE